MLFLLLYRFPEALLNTMTKTFILRPNSQGGLGLSPQEYGFANGTVGLIGLLLGGIIGGILVSRDGMKKWLWPMVMAITLPDAVYIFLSYPLTPTLSRGFLRLFVEQFGYGLGFTVLTLYMLFYSQGQIQTSHYSICTGISYLGLMLPGMLSGYLRGHGGLSPVLHHRHGVLHHHLRSHRLPQFDPLRKRRDPFPSMPRKKRKNREQSPIKKGRRE